MQKNVLQMHSFCIFFAHTHNFISALEVILSVLLLSHTRTKSIFCLHTFLLAIRLVIFLLLYFYRILLLYHLCIYLCLA